MAEGETTQTDQSRVNSIQALADLNAILTQLDNSPILQKAKCRFMGGYFDKNDTFHQFNPSDKNYKPPKMNERGWTVCEHFIDKNTCPNEALSNKNDKEIKMNVLVEGLVLADDLVRHYKEYEIDLDDLQFIVIELVALAFSGQKRALRGETAKAINKVVKQIESIVREDNKKKEGLWEKVSPK
jgi:hypothetical protein